MINRRRVCGGKGLPYDAEIEYLESSGTQYIDTNVIQADDLVINCTYLGVRSNVPNGTIFGCGYLDNSRYNILVRYYDGRNYNPWFANINNVKVALPSTPSTIELKFGSTICNGVEYSLSSVAGTLSNYSMYLFSANKDNKPWRNQPCRIYSFSISRNNQKIIDFIPVRVGTTGYMYDKVSGTLFGNNGTGSFILGADKGAVTSPVIDMGLPSGTLWAQGNIIKDANGNYAIGEPTDYGCYFSWGNIDGHNEGDGYSFDSDNYALTSGSQLTGNIPSDDALHDAAVARIGGGFHLPSGDQMTELFNSEYTTNEWTTLNGVNGRRVTSKINGNSVFFSAAGYYNGLSLNNCGLNGYYWSSRRINASFSYNLYFNSGSVSPQYNSRRYYGYLVRAVLNV